MGLAATELDVVVADGGHWGVRMLLDGGFRFVGPLLGFLADSKLGVVGMLLSVERVGFG